jgi:hypothetical protein
MLRNGELVLASHRVLGALGQHDGVDNIGFGPQPADRYICGFLFVVNELAHLTVSRQAVYGQLLIKYGLSLLVSHFRSLDVIGYSDSVNVFGFG